MGKIEPNFHIPLNFIKNKTKILGYFETLSIRTNNVSYLRNISPPTTKRIITIA